MSDALEEIADRDLLLRRIPDQPAMWTRKGGQVRPSSAAMQPSETDGGLSVDVRRLLPNPTIPTSVLGEHPEHGLVEFSARVPRELDLEVVHDPLPDRCSHANIAGFPGDRAAHLRVRRTIAKRSVWVKMPPGALATGLVSTSEE